MQKVALLRRLPWSIVVIALALLLVGWCGIVRSQQLADVSPRFLRRQIAWTLLCLVIMLAVAVPSYRVLVRWSYVAFAASLVLLVAVYLFPPVNSAHRWIRIAGIGLQPSEFAKLAFVLGLARYLMHRESYRTLAGLLAPLLLMMVPLLLVLREPDLGTALLFMPVLFVMLYAAGARITHLALVAVAAVSLAPIAWSQMSREQKSRITALAEQTGAGERPTDDGYHLHQAKQVMALGGVGGSWLGGDAEAGPRALFVPESHTDSISVVLRERFGLWGWGAMLGLYWLLVWRGLAIATQTREPFGRLAAIGIVSLLATQVLINTGMHLGLLPITGLTLPLISYGGSSLLATALGLGLLLNIGLRPGYEITNEPFRFR